jgi:hypothetical protein
MLHYQDSFVLYKTVAVTLFSSVFAINSHVSVVGFVLLLCYVALVMYVSQVTVYERYLYGLIK